MSNASDCAVAVTSGPSMTARRCHAAASGIPAWIDTKADRDALGAAGATVGGTAGAAGPCIGDVVVSAALGWPAASPDRCRFLAMNARKPGMVAEVGEHRRLASSAGSDPNQRTSVDSRTSAESNRELAVS